MFTKLVLTTLAAATAVLAAGQSLPTPTTEERRTEASRIQSQRQVVAEVGRAVAKHLVRVRVHYELERKRVDGVVYQRDRIVEGVCGGIIVTPDPLILISASSLRPDHYLKWMQVAPGFRTKAPDPRREYTFLLADGTEIEAEVVRRNRALNFLLLRPTNREDVPDALLHPLPLEPMRRPASGDMIGLVAFMVPDVDARTTTYVSVFPAEKASYPRPVIHPAGPLHSGMPVIFEDGTLAGIVNLPPPEEKRPAPRYDPRALVSGQDDTTRDPAEWATGFPRPVLMSKADLEPLVQDLLATTVESVSYFLLGLVLESRSEGLFVSAILDHGPAEKAAVREGDRVAGVAGHAVSGLAGFESALESVLGEGGSTLELTVERSDGSVQVLLDLAP